MSKNKRVAAFLLMICSTGALAQSGPMTIQEWTNRQAEIKRAEQEAKLEEQRRKTNVSTPVQIARTCDADIAMFAVYGVGEKLWADFGFHGATVTLAAGGQATDQTIVINGSVPGLIYLATADVPWLKFSPEAGSMPANVTVSASAASLTPGNYTATITLEAIAQPFIQSVPVTFTVTAPGAPSRCRKCRR